MLDLDNVRARLLVSRERNYVFFEGFQVCKNVLLTVSIETDCRLMFSFEDVKYGDIGIWYVYQFQSLDALASIDDAILDWILFFENYPYRDIEDYFKVVGVFEPDGFIAFKPSSYVEQILKAAAN